ncbi:IS256 family transposase, partial [Skermania sp. ID1734]|uniref:transposase n=1 Tax=Skermania sp. ID1734 TaxID=2597516 RepID=UPI0011951862
MTAVTEDSLVESPSSVLSPLSNDELIAQLVARARADGLKLTGQDGLLGQLTKRVVESALEGELDDHLGYDRHERGGSADGNTR